MKAVIPALRSLLATNLASNVTTFMSGPVELIAKSDMPAINVYGNQTSITLEGTVRCKTVFQITIDVYVDLRKFFDTTAGQGTQIDALDKLYEIILMVI